MLFRQSIISNSLWVFVQQFSKLGFQFFISIYLARLLDPSHFGIIAIVQVFISISNSIINSGLTQSIIRTPKIDDTHYSTVFWYLLLISIIVYFTLNLFSTPISTYFDSYSIKTVLPWLSLNIVFNVISAVVIAKLTKELKFKAQMLASLPSFLLSGTIGIIMAYNNYGVWSLVVMLMLQSFLHSTTLLIQTKWRPKLIFSKAIFKYHYNFGYKLSISAIIYTISSELNSLIIARIYPIYQVGYYNKANGYSLLTVTSLSSVLKTVSYPYFVKLKEDKNKIKMAYSKIMQLAFFTIAPLMMFLIIYATPLFNFILTSKWLPAAPYFQILCVGAVLYPIHSYNLNILNVYGRTDLNLRLQVIKTISYILIIIITVQWGIKGLLWGNVLHSYLVFFINSHYSGKFIGFDTYSQVKKLLPTLCVVAIVGLINWGVFIKLTAYSDIIQLTIGLPMFVLCYFLMAYVAKIGALNDIYLIYSDMIKKF